MDRKEDEDKIRQQFDKVVKELQKWPEYRVKQMVKRRLKDEGWIVSTISCSTEPGKDLEATKGPRTIIIEAEGESESSNNYRQDRQECIRVAFASIIQYMREDNLDRAYFIAFPNNDYYSRRIRELIPDLVRMKLDLNILFIDENGSLDVLLASGTKIHELPTFDFLFDAD